MTQDQEIELRGEVDIALGGICHQLSGRLAELGDVDLAESFRVVGDDLQRERVPLGPTAA